MKNAILLVFAYIMFVVCTPVEPVYHGRFYFKNDTDRTLGFSKSENLFYQETINPGDSACIYYKVSGHNSKLKPMFSDFLNIIMVIDVYDKSGKHIIQWKQGEEEHVYDESKWSYVENLNERREFAWTLNITEDMLKKPVVSSVIPPVQTLEDGGILPVEVVPEKLSSFFASVFVYSSHEYDMGFGLKDEDDCIVINSMEEFFALAPSGTDKNIEIDFDNYSLMIGRHVAKSLMLEIKSQAVYIGENDMIFKVVYEDCDDVESSVTMYYNFWGLYHKLPEKDVKLEVTVL